MKVSFLGYAWKTMVAISSLYGAIEFWEWLNRPDAPLLQVQAEFSEAEIPDSIRQWHSTMCDAYSPSRFREFVDKRIHEVENKRGSGESTDNNSLSQYELHRLEMKLVDAATDFHSELQDKIHDGPRLESLRGFARIRIANSGDLAAQDVSIQLKGEKGIAKIGRDSSATVEFKNTIEVGQIAAEEEIEVTIWTEWVSSAPKDALLTHAAGKQRIEFPIAVTGFFAFFSQHWFFVTIVVPAILFAVLICVLSLYTGTSVSVHVDKPAKLLTSRYSPEILEEELID